MSDSSQTGFLCETVKQWLFSTLQPFTFTSDWNGYILFVQSILLQPKLNHRKKKRAPLSSFSSLLQKSLRGGRKGEKNDLKTEKTETGKPNFTNSQTDIGYMGEVGTGG